MLRLLFRVWATIGPQARVRWVLILPMGPKASFNSTFGMIPLFWAFFFGMVLVYSGAMTARKRGCRYMPIVAAGSSGGGHGINSLFVAVVGCCLWTPATSEDGKATGLVPCRGTFRAGNQVRGSLFSFPSYGQYAIWMTRGVPRAWSWATGGSREPFPWGYSCTGGGAPGATLHVPLPTYAGGS